MQPTAVNLLVLSNILMIDGQNSEVIIISSFFYTVSFARLTKEEKMEVVRFREVGAIILGWRWRRSKSGELSLSTGDYARVLK